MLAGPLRRSAHHRPDGAQPRNEWERGGEEREKHLTTIARTRGLHPNATYPALAIATGIFAIAVEDRRPLAKRIVDHAEGHLRIDVDEVTWGHVADADRALDLLRQSARVMGIELESDR